MNAIIAFRVLTTIISAAGILLFLYLIITKRQGRGFRFLGLIALAWLFSNYFVYWTSGQFPDSIHIAGATLALASYIVAGGIYAAFTKRN